MAEKLEIYKCLICGNIVEDIHEGDGDLVCCGQQMEKLPAKTSADEGKEKHVPVIEKADGRIKVKVGSIPHPMEQKHYIEWIAILADGREYRRFLNPGEAPEAVFETQDDSVTVKEYCNVHGLWKG